MSNERKHEQERARATRIAESIPNPRIQQYRAEIAEKSPNRAPEVDREIANLVDRRKNYDFTQVYRPGWNRIRKFSQGPLRLWALLAENLDPQNGAVVASQGHLAEMLGVTTRTVRNWIHELEEDGALVKIPVHGNVCAYALNPQEVWAGYNNGKDYAAFNAKTLARKDPRVAERIKAMIKDQRKDGDNPKKK